MVVDYGTWKNIKSLFFADSGKGELPKLDLLGIDYVVLDAATLFAEKRGSAN